MSLRKSFSATAAAILCLFALPVFAQDNGGGATPQDNTIDFSAAVGVGATYLRVGVSKHGNVIEFNSPLGVEHIRAGVFREGYVLTSGAGNTVNGFDWAGGESAWGAGSTSGNLALGTLKITRKTADNQFLLTQQYKIGPANLKLTVTMTVKNVTGLAKTNVWLTRIAEWDVAGAFPNDWMSSPLSVLATNGYGILTTAQAVAAPSVVFQSFATSLGSFDQTPFGVNPALGLDGQARVAFPLGTINAGASKTVKIFYQRV